MKKTIAILLLLALLCTFPAPIAQAAGGSITLSEQYLFAGRNGDWYTEEAYEASPVVTDLDGDGTLEVLNAAYSLVVMDAATGTEKWRINAGHDRSTPYADTGNTARQVFSDFKVLDVDADGRKEIVIGYGNGTVSVLNDQGYFEPGWPQQPTTGSITSLVVADLDLDGKMEIIVAAAVTSSVSVWVYHCDGTLAKGWPQLEAKQDGAVNHSITGTAYSYGVFNNNVTVGDLTGDGKPEVIVPTDTAYIDAYYADGTLVKASDIYGGRTWGKIALYEDYDQEIACVNEGWGFPIRGDETRAELYRSELGHSAARYTDVDGDGVSEIVVTALMSDRTGHTNTNIVTLHDTRYMTVFILNQDRSRYVNKELGFDWTKPPVDLGRSLKLEDKISMSAGVASEPVCVDLDGDGYQEILFNSYNGKLHCFSLDGKEHGSWPFTLPKSNGDIYEFACPPTYADVNGDGKLEIIFASTAGSNSDPNATTVNGALYVLSNEGKLLASIDLHNGYATFEGVIHHSNGVTATPTVQDIDGDGKYEILLNTSYYALCAYEVNVTGSSPSPAPSGTAYARTQTITINGNPVMFHTYALLDENGYDTNYVRVRDLALALNDTGSRFNVGWDGAVNLQAHTPYTPDGTEMSTPFSGDRTYEKSSSPTRVDGREVAMDAIALADDAGGGYTYYKLRDLGSVLGFEVDWTLTEGIIVNA